MFIFNGMFLKIYSVIKFIKERNYFIKKIKGVEFGIDFIALLNMFVYVSVDGIVDFVKINFNVGYGNLVRIEYVFGFSFIYMYLDYVNV